MRAGPMKYKITLLRPETVVNGFGESDISWVETATVWAERVKLSGSRDTSNSDAFPYYRVEYNIRDAHEVGENWRCKELGGYLYSITNICPNIDRGMNTLICDRVNE